MIALPIKSIVYCTGHCTVISVIPLKAMYCTVVSHWKPLNVINCWKTLQGISSELNDLVWILRLKYNTSCILWYELWTIIVTLAIFINSLKSSNILTWWVIILLVYLKSMNILWIIDFCIKLIIWYNKNKIANVTIECGKKLPQ